MKHIMSALVAIVVIAGVAAPASAACRLNGWIDTGQNPKPVWKCDEPHPLHSHAGQVHHPKQAG
jgi:hypothetical protein